ncbi:hypothetical protein ACDX66_12380 [Peribacillus frigoritolerans]
MRNNWLEENIQSVEDKFVNAELGSLDVIRQYGVIIVDATNKALRKQQNSSVHPLEIT